MAQRATWAGSRLLLRRLRDVMAGSGSAQERLDLIAQTIARDMVAEVCSIYVRRAGDVIELFATEGLHADAVHKIRFRFGEGIVGVVAASARPIALAEAQKHPNFAYRPETGEEIYQSMLGVPILRGGRVLGVLAIQNRTQREYAEEEIETLETVGMVIAEMLATGEVINSQEQQPVDGLALKPLRLEGIRISPGLALGNAVLHQPTITITDPIAEDEEEEIRRIEEAMSDMHSALDTLIARFDGETASDHLDILRTFRMVAEDRGWIRRIREAIGTGLTAEAAVARVQNDTRARMAVVQDPYIRERLADFEELTNRLQQHLAGDIGPSGITLPDNAVLVARQLGPAELLDYDHTKLRGVVLEEGSVVSHVAIVARALDIPVVGRVRGAVSRIEPLDRIVVDGQNGVCFIRPGEDFQRVFSESMDLYAAQRAAYARDRDKPTVTVDGVDVNVFINAGLLIDVPHLEESGAVGIGLYRTEVPFMVRSGFPNVDEQRKLYQSILDQAGSKPVVFRTLDIGGDKIPSYVRESEEENPALGWRALRIGLDRPYMLRQQLRALLEAASGRALHVMFPMVAEVAEFDAARAILDLEIKRAATKGIEPPSSMAVGTMLEVPALVFQLPVLLSRVDFISVGSNDLQQFLFASDRGNPKLDGRYDPLAPGMLRMLKTVQEACEVANVPLALCGEMAGSPIEALALIGLGFRRLSMNASSVGPIRAMVRSVHCEKLSGFVESIMNSHHHSLRSYLASYAKDHKIQI